MLLDAVFLCVAVAGLAMNFVLIGLARRVRHEVREMRLVMLLALVDLVLPTLSIACVGYHVVAQRPIDALANACNVKGAVDFLGVFLSMSLVAAIALARSSVILNWRVPLVLKLGLGGFGACYGVLVLVCAARGEFHVLEAEIYCSPVSTNSAVSMAVLVLHALGLLVFLAITVVSYARILVSIALPARQEFVSLHDKESCWVAKRPVLLRTGVMIVSYLAVVLPPAVLLLVEAILQEQVASSLNTPIDIFLVSISVLNPALVLFAHSIIFQQLTLAIRSYF